MGKTHDIAQVSMLRSIYILALLLLTPILATAATVELRHENGAVSPFAAELGDTLNLEILLDAGTDELSGYALFISYDPTIFSLVEAGVDADGQLLPFAQADYLGGIVLVNQFEVIEEEAFLSYAEAASAQRSTTSGLGIAARFSLAITRRPSGDAAEIRIEERGHDHSSHFVTSAAPGVEQRFSEPLGLFSVRITGFRILPLPDVVLIEGEQQIVLDLDEFIDQEVGEVLWTHSILSEIPTSIDPETRQVTMRAEAGLVGRRQMRFTAGALSENPAEDIIDIEVRSRPKISAFPDTVVFLEDGSNSEHDLDAFVEDLDDLQRTSQTWSVTGAVMVQVEVAEGSRIASFTADPDWSGKEHVLFTVRDEHGHTDTVSTLVLVSPVNDAPVAKRIPPVYPTENGEPVRIPLDQLVQDKDDEVGNLRLAFEPFEGGVWAEVENDELVIHGDVAGRGVVRFVVSDLAGASDSTRQVAVVLAPGQSIKPEIDPLPSLRFRGGSIGSLDLNLFVQDDGPLEALQWSTDADSVLTATVSNGVLSVSGTSGFAGAASVRLTARDQEGNEASEQVVVEILTAVDPLGPEILDIGKVELLAGGDTVVLALDNLVIDPDNEAQEMNWTIEVSDGIDSVFDPASRMLSLSAADGQVGVAEVVLTVADPNVNTDSRSLAILVANSGGAPVLRPVADVVLDALGDQERIDLDDFAFDDEDRDSELLWTVVGVDGVEAQIDPVTHELVLKRTDSAGTPTASVQVILQVADTNGQVESVLINVGLPPIFSLDIMPDIEFFAGAEDNTLILSNFVLPRDSQPALIWQVAPPLALDVEIDLASTQVLIRAKSRDFVGIETLTFTATDQTLRWRTARVRVFVRSRGLTPQILDFGSVVVRQGESLTLALDNFVVDDDAPEVLQWQVSGGGDLQLTFASATRELTLDAANAAPGRREIQLLVEDVAGNITLGAFDATVLASGEAPVISPLPNPLVAANGLEQRILGLDAYVTDPDTPDAQIRWEVSVEPGISARVVDRQLLVTVPIGQGGSRQVILTARDPDGNEVMETLQIFVLEDLTLPEFTLEIGRHPVFSELVEIEIIPSEPLLGAPQVEVNGMSVEVQDRGDGTFVAVYQVPDMAGAQFANVEVRGVDEAGNEGKRNAALALYWMDQVGGQLTYSDLQLGVNVPSGAAGAGRLALIYRLAEGEAPPGHEDQPVYDVRLAREAALDHPITISFLVGPNPPADLGVLRWNGSIWEPLLARFDEQTGTLAATVDETGLFRLGTVSPELLRLVAKFENYPNPFNPAQGSTRFVYELERQNRVQLRLFNIMGQPVRMLVDEVQSAGLWTALWDGRNVAGKRQANGIYFCEFFDGKERHCLKFTLINGQSR